LSESEWEYVARAGTTTPFWWGSWITSHQANYDGTLRYADRGLMWPFRNHKVPVDCFKPNPWGLYQVHGNVYEWCDDVPSSYEQPPVDGSACIVGDLRLRMYRGGAYASPPSHLRSACRGSFFVDHGLDCLGFRVARCVLPGVGNS
jgi:formylglycine-generating enzyme required for sulfatase activity